jgi:hypothetical protein
MMVITDVPFHCPVDITTTITGPPTVSKYRIFIRTFPSTPRVPHPTLPALAHALPARRPKSPVPAASPRWRLPARTAQPDPREIRLLS